MRVSNGSLLLALIALLVPGKAGSQSSASHRIEGASLTAGSGTTRSSAHLLVGGTGVDVAVGRSSGGSSDVIGGFIGQAYSPRARIRIETSQVEYVSIAFPVKPTSAQVVDVLDELGQPDPAVWRLGHWSPADSAYVEPGEDLSAIEPGQGYFLITADSAVVLEEGLTAPVQEFEIELESGPGGRPAYNQLGNPFLFPIAPSDLVVTDGNITVPLLSPENTLTEAAVKIYDPETGAYVTNPSSIEPRTAFWVKKLVPGAATVLVPFRAGASSEPKALTGRPEGARWAVSVAARQGARSCEPILVGSAPVAAEGWNSLCISRAPDPPGRRLSIGLREADWGRLSGDYVRVFRPAAESMSWDLVVRGAEAPGELTLNLQSFDLPSGARVLLGDPAAGWSEDVTGRRSWVVAARPENRLRLTVELGPSVPGPVRVDGLRHVYPNPFRDRSGLVFTVAHGAAVSASIIDVAGRCIRRLSARVAEGERVLVWDGNDEQGRRVPPGVYLARYRVNQTEGVARLVKIE